MPPKERREEEKLEAAIAAFERDIARVEALVRPKEQRAPADDPKKK